MWRCPKKSLTPVQIQSVPRDNFKLSRHQIDEIQKYISINLRDLKKMLNAAVDITLKLENKPLGVSLYLFV